MARRLDQQRISLEDRFEIKVDRSAGHGPRGECHVWIAGCNSWGYGNFWYEGRTVNAQMIAWFLATNKWPEFPVLHRCDNPPCVRREHLFLGTHVDNMGNMVSKQRQARGDRCANTKLTPAEVLEIRALQGVEYQRITAVRYRVARSTVSAIQNLKHWRHL